MYRGGEEVKRQLTSTDAEWSKSLHTFTRSTLVHQAQIKGTEIGRMLTSIVSNSSVPKGKESDADMVKKRKLGRLRGGEQEQDQTLGCEAESH